VSYARTTHVQMNIGLDHLFVLRCHNPGAERLVQFGLHEATSMAVMIICPVPGVGPWTRVSSTAGDR